MKPPTKSITVTLLRYHYSTEEERDKIRYIYGKEVHKYTPIYYATRDDIPVIMLKLINKIPGSLSNIVAWHIEKIGIFEAKTNIPVNEFIKMRKQLYRATVLDEDIPEKGGE